MSGLRRPFLYDRYIFVTVRLLPSRVAQTLGLMSAISRTAAVVESTMADLRFKNKPGVRGQKGRDFGDTGLGTRDPGFGIGYYTQRNK